MFAQQAYQFDHTTAWPCRRNASVGTDGPINWTETMPLTISSSRIGTLGLRPETARCPISFLFSSIFLLIPTRTADWKLAQKGSRFVRKRNSGCFSLPVGDLRQRRPSNLRAEAAAVAMRAHCTRTVPLDAIKA